MSNVTSQEVTEVIITEGSLRSYVNVEVHYLDPLPLWSAQQKKREHKKSDMGSYILLLKSDISLPFTFYWPTPVRLLHSKWAEHCDPCVTG